MENLYITSIHIDKVRHLENIDIPLSINEKKHLILTGKNGSGKTSVLDAIASYIRMYTASPIQNATKISERIAFYKQQITDINLSDEQSKMKLFDYKQSLETNERLYKEFYKGLTFELSSAANVMDSFKMGQFTVAYYSDNRVYKAEEAIHIEKIELKDNYALEESPGIKLVKYLLDLKTTAALADKAGKHERANEIEAWFYTFESMLKAIFNDTNLKLEFNIDSFAFTIHQTGREPFDFNHMSSGYSAVLDIIVDLMMRMEKNKKNYSYAQMGVVLIDEIETHLHIELQKNILPFLTKTFPNIQFIISTHSPFILNSINNAVIYDLEKQQITGDLSAYSYEGIVEYYFDANMYSNKVKEQFELYKKLINKQNRTIDEDKRLIESITLLKQTPPAAAPELVNAFRDMEAKRRDIVNGKN